MTEPPVVYLVDDDPLVRRALARVIRGAGLEVETRETAGEFLAHDHSRRPACLVLDVHLPRMRGPDLQDRLASTDPDLPIVVVTAHGEEDVRRRMLQAGPSAFSPIPAAATCCWKRSGARSSARDHKEACADRRAARYRRTSGSSRPLQENCRT